MTNLILASSSLGRKKLLSYLKIPFKIIPSDLEESKIIGKNPLDTLRLRAKLKGESISNKILSSNDQSLKTKDYLILSADSGAILDNKLIGKPKDRTNAVRILQTLSGRTHKFVTAVYVIKQQSNISNTVLDTFSESLVTFRKIRKEEINFYLSVTDFTRYAASYALISAQDFITKVEGSQSNVIGLPLEIVSPFFRKNWFIPKLSQSARSPLRQ